MRTKGSKNLLESSKLYNIKACIPLLKKYGLVEQPSWYKGGLNEDARNFGLKADWDNGISGMGHREKFLGKTLYQLVNLKVNGEKKATPSNNVEKMPMIGRQISMSEITEDSQNIVLEVGAQELKSGVIHLESFDLSNLSTEQIRSLKTEIDDYLLNMAPDWKNIKPGDSFNYRGYNWTCLDPEFQAVNGVGCLAIMSELYENETVFNKKDDNNYLESDLRKKMNEVCEKIQSGNIDVMLAHEIDTTAENGEDKFGSYEGYVFPLSIQEYIRYAKFVPIYDNRHWLRSPLPSYAILVRIVSTDGSLNSLNAFNASGVAPACIFNRQI